MCDFSKIAIGLYLLGYGERFFHCAFFWGIIPASMALITPGLVFTYPHPEYVNFYYGHGLILLGVVIWGVIGLTRAYNCVDNRSDCPQSSGEKPKSGAPIELLWMSLLILISVGLAIKARITQLKNRKNKSE